jgi:hypothetical protein
MKKILFLVSIIGLLCVTTACQPEGVVYDPGDRVDATFPSTLINFAMLATDGNQIQIEMWRGNTKGAVSIPVTITNNTAGVFTPQKTTFDFADGESKAYLKFTYPSINNFGGEKYTLSVAITNANQVSYGGNKTISITAQRKLTFQTLGTGLFTSEFFGESWSQVVQKAAEADYYRLPDCYYSGYPIEFSINNGKVSFAKQAMGYRHSTYGMTYWDPGYVAQCTVVGKKITFIVDFRVTAGSFGVASEVLDLP